MKGRYSKELSHAFVVSPDELKKLVELLQKRIGEVDISVKCADDFSREFNTVKELIAYENPKPKRIRSIRLGARSDDYSKSATIVFRDHFFFRSGISIDATGREDVVSRLKEEILDVVAGMCPWYNFAFHPTAPIIIGVIFGMISGASSGVRFRRQRHKCYCLSTRCRTYFHDVSRNIPTIFYIFIPQTI